MWYRKCPQKHDSGIEWISGKFPKGGEGGGHFRSKKFHCNFFCFRKNRNIFFPKKGRGGRGQGPFGNFPEIHPFWYARASLSDWHNLIWQTVLCKWTFGLTGIISVGNTWIVEPNCETGWWKIIANFWPGRIKKNGHWKKVNEEMRIPTKSKMWYKEEILHEWGGSL